jgi:hypothetical protein
MAGPGKPVPVWRGSLFQMKAKKDGGPLLPDGMSGGAPKVSLQAGTATETGENSSSSLHIWRTPVYFSQELIILEDYLSHSHSLSIKL